MKLCSVCSNPIKHYKTSKTCGYSCSNTLFRSGPNNPNWKDSTYTTTCFHYHTKECVICQESNIVEVHHLDENHKNNSPSNLIPLCPTHHQYWHSRYRHIVEPQIRKYIENWNAQCQNGETRTHDSPVSKTGGIAATLHSDTVHPWKKHS